MSEEKDLTTLAEYESDPEEEPLLRGTDKAKYVVTVSVAYLLKGTHTFQHTVEVLRVLC